MPDHPHPTKAPRRRPVSRRNSPRRKPALRGPLERNALVEQHYELIHATITAMIRRGVLRARLYDEACSEAVISLYRAAELWDGQRPFRTYAISCMWAYVLRYLQALTREPLSSATLEPPFSSREPPPDLHVIERDHLERLLSPLHSRQRHVVMLWLSDHTTKEIGALLGVSHQRINQVLQQAFDRLRAHFEDRRSNV